MRGLQANQGYEGSLQKANWDGGAEKFGDLITGDRRVANERKCISTQSSIFDRDTRLSQSYPCRTQTSQETEKS